MKLFNKIGKKKMLIHICIVLIISMILSAIWKTSIENIPFNIIVIGFLYYIFLIIKYFIKDLINGHKTYVPSSDSHPKKKQYRFKYKSEWAWEDAAQEYLKLKNKKKIDELSQEENEIIYKYASMPLAYFVMWLIENDFIDEDYHMFEEWEEVKERKETPVEFISRNDYYFSGQDIAEKIIPFVDYYYDNIYENSNRDKSDYYQCIKNENGLYYCIDFSWDIYDRIANKINNAYKKYKEEKENRNGII